MRMQRRWTGFRELSVTVYNELFRTRAFVVAAALSFYFFLALVPLLIFLSSLLGFLPIPNLAPKMLDMAATFVPPDAMALVQKIVLADLVSPHGGVLSFGLLSYLWTATGGFAAMIEALGVAYEVEICRPWWRDRLQALLLTFTTGGLVLMSLLLLTVGPSFGRILERVFPVPEGFGRIWQTLHFAVTFLTFMLGIVFLYILGPNVKVRFRSALPGAALAVVGWFIGSFGFSFYLRHFASYNATYGSLAGVMVLMLWFYIVAIAMLVGAEVNAEMAKRGAVQHLGPGESKGIPSAVPRDQAVAGPPGAG